MKRLKQVQQSVLALSDNEFRELYRWITELDHKKWDKEIEKDSESGLLDELADQAVADFHKGLSKRL
ncbi:MAG: hypothetical protein BWK80_14460 [Desulfobacteraceae bacterium IS3]|nr:MAG: hypothetical protein BWK80_14460 [Desulfobacteraceae bacterium IS3]